MALLYQQRICIDVVIFLILVMETKMISCDIFGTGSHDIYIFIINIIIFKYLNYMIGRDILFQLDHN